MTTHHSARAVRLLWLTVLAVFVASSAWATWVLITQNLSPAAAAGIIVVPVTVAGMIAAVMQFVLGQLGERRIDLVRSVQDLADEVRKREDDERYRLLGGDTKPIDIEFRFAPSAGRDAEGAASRGTLTDVVAFYRRLRPQRMVITGKDGAGKTVLAIELALALVNNRASTDPVPVRVSLPGWDMGFELTSWLAGLIAASYELSPRAAQALVNAGLVLPILDGLDEVDTTGATGNTRSPRMAALVRRLNQYHIGGRPGALVLTSRSQVYDTLIRAGADRLRDAARVEIQPVAPEQSARYLLSRTTDQDRWRPVCDYLRRYPHSMLAALLSTPWRLNLAFTVYEAGKNPAALLRYTDFDALHEELLAEYVNAAVRLTPWFGETDVPDMRNDERHTEKGNWQAEEVQQWLRTLAKLVSKPIEVNGSGHVSEITAANGTDLVPHLLWLAAGMRKVRIVHTAVGAAILIAAFYSLFAILGTPDFTTAPTNFPAAHENLLAVIFQFTIVGAFSVAACWWIWGYRWPRVHVGTQPSIRLWPRPVAGWLWHAVENRPDNRGLVYSAQLVASLVRRRNLSTAKAIVRRRQDRARWSPSAGMGSPMDALRAYPRYILWLSLLAATFMTFVFMMGGLLVITIRHLATSRDFPIEAVAVEFFKVWLWLVALSLTAAIVLLSRTPWARYFVGVALAACSGRSPLPLRLGRFLEWACDAGLLRRAGATYQFRHYELQEWLQRDR